MIALTFPKHSPLLPAVNTALMELSEHGFYDKFERVKLRDLRAHRNRIGFWSNDLDKDGVKSSGVPCDFNRLLVTLSDEYAPLSLDQLQGLFIVWTIGMCLGIVAFVLEHVRHRKVASLAAGVLYPRLSVVNSYSRPGFYTIVLAWRVFRWWRLFPKVFNRRFEHSVQLFRARVLPLMPVIRQTVHMDYSAMEKQ
jgi:hypothetical protein